MKSLKQHFLDSWQNEEKAFVAVFMALPEEKLDYKPDTKSRTAVELASMLSQEPQQLAVAMETGELAFNPSNDKKLTTPTEMVENFKVGMAKVKTLIEAMDETAWDSEAKMIMDGQVVWKSPKGDMALGFLFDMVHHRGQLATYIRPMGGKVPSIYGPSADAQS